MQYVLVGNFGVGNVGDEAIKQYYLERFPEIDWKIFSANPTKGEYHRFPFGIRSLFRPWWRSIAMLKNSQGMVFAGGSLFTDAESIFACYLWGWHAWIAKRMGKPIILAFQGIGPFRSAKAEHIARWVVRHADFVSVRDESSADRIRSFGYTKVVQTFDPVFWLFSQHKTDVRSQNVLVFIPRKNSTETFKKGAREAYKRHQNAKVAIVLLEPDAPEEKMFAKELRSEWPDATVLPMRDVEALRKVLHDAVAIVSERYHGIIPALGLGIPVNVVIQKEGDKLSSLRDLIAKGESTEKLLAQVEEGYVALREDLFSRR